MSTIKPRTAIVRQLVWYFGGLIAPCAAGLAIPGGALRARLACGG